MGHISKLAAVFGCPVIRLRTAIPEELLSGGMAAALGRSRGLSAEALQETARLLQRHIQAASSQRKSLAQARPLESARAT